MKSITLAVFVLVLSLMAGCRNRESLNSALISAIWSGDVEKVEKLIADGAEVNQPQRSGEPLLSSALTFTHENKARIVMLLLDHHVDPNEQDKNGDTPLFSWFRWDKSPAILDILLKHGANLNQIGSQGETILSLAIEYPVPDPKFIQLLLKKGSDPNVQNKNGETALHQAVSSLRPHQVEIVNLLLANGVKVNIKDHKGQIALNKVAGCPPEIATSLVLVGSNLSGFDDMGETPLLAAARWHYFDAMRLMIDKGANVNAKDKWGTTALFKAVGDLAIVKALVEKGANVNEVNTGGFTPLHFAAAEYQVDVAEYLISKGARVNVKNKDGLTPLEYAKSRHNPGSAEEQRRKNELIAMLSRLTH